MSLFTVAVAAVAACLSAAAHADVYPNGLLVSYQEVSVSPRSSGVVEKIFVREGQWIAQRDKIGILDSAKEEMDVRATELDLEQQRLSLDKLKQGTPAKEIEKMEVDIEKAKLAKEKAEADLARVKRLFEEKAVSEKDVLDAKNTLDVAALSVKSLEIALDISKDNPKKEDVVLQEMKITQTMLTLDQKKLAVEKMTVLSTTAGVISKLYYAPGENASAGQPFCDVLNTDSLYVELNLPVSEIKRIKTGTKATVTVPVITPQSFPGFVVFVSPTVDPASRTFKIRIEIANPNRLLKPGLFATVSI